MYGYEYIARFFKEYGLTHYFYIEAMLRIAAKEMGAAGIHGILAHSENAAGYMADGYARVTGKPGVCMAQSIGAANLAGGIYDAFLACSPVIAITGKKRPPFQYKNSYQEADHRLLYEGITKFNAEYTNEQQLPFLLRQCYRAAVTGKPRPVHLDLPNRMGRIAEMAEIKEPLYVEEIYKKFPAYRSAASEKLIASAVIAIKKSERPVIVAGRGASVSGAGPEIHGLAKKADIPVVTSPDGKTLINEYDSLWAGIVGDYGMDCANKTVARADLVIFIGTQTADQTTLNWTIPLPTVKTIQIDIDPSELGKNYPNCVGLLGDAKTVCAQLVQAVEDAKRPAWRQEAVSFVKVTLDEYQKLQVSDGAPIHPARLCNEISKALPDNAILFADTGFSAVWTATMLRMKSSQRYFRAAGSLGWAFPASLGAKCALLDIPVFCFAGDAAFFYHLSEMETALRYGIKTVTFINNNQILGQSSGGIKAVYKDDPSKAAARYQFLDLNLSKIAQDFGFAGIRVEKPGDIAGAITNAVQLDKPVIVEVMTDKNATVQPALKT
jgi:acetolactate synthase-1/2/3 large subunit